MRCRLCGGEDLSTVLDFGVQYVSDFVTEAEVHSGEQLPIELVLCRRCTLVQQRYSAPQNFLYERHYWYRSGVTQTMRTGLSDVTTAAERLVHLEYGDVVLDIGSNDGTLLRSYRSSAYRVGFEPAENLREVGRIGVDCLVSDFWSAEAYFDRKLPLAKVVTAIGMLYDLEDPNRFVADVAKVLHPDGVFIAQLQCLRQMLDLGDVGNLCHEHLEFYSLLSLMHLFERHGLQLFDLEENAINGGSYRLYIRHASEAPLDYSRVFKALLDEQRLRSLSTYEEFYDRVCRNRDRCVEFIRDVVEDGCIVWVYGASTKGNVILQWYGLGTLVEAAADSSLEKVGRYTVGTGIPIRSERAFREAQPNYALVLPYAFLSEFMEREADWRSKGGKFIVPLPEVRIV